MKSRKGPDTPKLRRSEGGFTLLEVVIAGAILVVLGGIAITVVISASQHASGGATISHMDQECREILDRVATDLRSADLRTLALPPGAVDAIPATNTAPWRVWTGLQFQTAPNSNAAFNPFNNTTSNGTTINWTSLASPDPVNGRDDNNDGIFDIAASLIRRGENLNLPITVSRRGVAWDNTVPTGGTTLQPPAWANNSTPPSITFLVRRLQPFPAVTVPPSARYEARVYVTVTLQGVDGRGRRIIRSMTTTVNVRNN